MQDSNTQPDAPSFGQWLWLSGFAGAIGQAAVAAIVFFNITTIFDYNGKSSGPDPLSVLEWSILIANVTVGGIAAFFLRRAWAERGPNCFRPVHLLPLLFSLLAILAAVLMVIFAASQIIY
ncbi:MAG: hypothetical protein GY747_06500 [Planctomycetes bacterium]|nr:hypothetical protein [Planctomycetota bacterium]MCP4771422.1 hypothetical protein [Planctomycetota bacterium]MCP4861859.1 hypothetical protein [Planctomycetota bacterium]